MFRMHPDTAWNRRVKVPGKATTVLDENLSQSDLPFEQCRKLR
jgi:hypothetical protein